MGFILNLAELFCCSLGMGVYTFSVFANSQKTGVALVKLLAIVSFCALALGGTLHIYREGIANIQNILYFTALCLSGLTWFFHSDKKNLWMWGVYVFYVITMLSLFVLKYPYVEKFFFTLSSSLFLGIVTYTMILGHWYLVTPKLSVSPLKRALTVFWILLALKSTVAIYGLFVNDFYGSKMELLMPLVRIVWGYLVVGIMGYFGHRLVLMRSIQSATGIFYAMTFFVLMGEIIAGGLFFESGILL